MTLDGRSALPRSSVLLHDPVSPAIREFLATHHDQPARSAAHRLLGRSPLTEQSAPWYWTAVGQLDVMDSLDELGSEWTVVHGVPGPAAVDGEAATTIDHLVIGRAGVFIITTYDHAKQNIWVTHRAFVVDGHRLQYIRRAEEAVGHVERVLHVAAESSVRATAVIAVINPGSLQVRDLPADVFVVTAASLTSWLKARAGEMSVESVVGLSSVAVVPATWALTAEPGAVLGSGLSEAMRERAEFSRVRREVKLARFVRSSWAIGVVALLTGTMVAVGILQLVSARP